MRGKRKLRENLPNRVYHLISRVAHRAFFLNAEERARFVELLKRVAAFSGIELLAYCVMANHVHILVFVPEPEELSDEEVLSRMRILYRDSRFAEHKPDSLGEVGDVEGSDPSGGVRVVEWCGLMGSGMKRVET